MYGQYSELCFNMRQSRNKRTLEKFEGKCCSFIELPLTEKINGLYRYQTLAYLYTDKDDNLVVIVNVTYNSIITLVNATKS